MDQDFEEMQAVKFLWLMTSCGRLLSLKEASNLQAWFGIVLSIIILVFGAGGSFLLLGLRSHNYAYFYGLPENFVACMVGIESLLKGLLLLIYSIILLNKVWDNRAAAVFKTIKVGCLTFLYIQLIESFLYGLVCLLLLTTNLTRTPIPDAVLIGGSVGYLLVLLLTTLVIYGVHSVKSKIISMYIHIEGIFFLFSSVILGLSIANVFPALIIQLIFVVSLRIYILRLFVLHVNMMTIGTAPPKKYQLELDDI